MSLVSDRHCAWTRAACWLPLLLAACQSAPPVAPAPSVSLPPAGVPVEARPLTPPAPQLVPVAPKLGLALGGGAARGFAHVGVIQVLEEQGIRPALVVGTSAGSVVAAMYASGKTGTQLATLAETMDETAFADWAYPGRGLLRGEALARYVREQTGQKLIEQMPLPLGIVATDLDNGQPILFRRGDTGTAARASSAVPAVFQPVRISGREYVDGGLVSPVPVRFAKQMGADLVLAVDISAVPDGAPTGDAMRMLLQTFSIMGRSINEYELRDAAVVLRPKLANVASTDFTARKRAIQAGRDAALAALPALKLAIEQHTRMIAAP